MDFENYGKYLIFNIKRILEMNEMKMNEYLFQYHQRSCSIRKIGECSDAMVPLFLKNRGFHP